MSSGMFLIQGETLVEMTEQKYDTEEQLQKWLAQWPNLLAGDQIDSSAPRQWLLVSREFGIPDRSEGRDRWFLDHLFLDQDAVPTLVEVKRSSDTRARREVVAQMLDYAANGVAYTSMERMRNLYETRCLKENLSMERVFFDAFGEDGDVEAFWQKAKTNLEAGHIRMIFVADEISTELLRIVEFLNKQMKPAEVLAFEIKKYSGLGATTLIPRILGQTAEAQTKKTGSASSGEPWDEARFMAVLEGRPDKKEMEVAKALLEWASALSLHAEPGKGTGLIGYIYLKVDLKRPYLLTLQAGPETSGIRDKYHLIPVTL